MTGLANSGIKETKEALALAVDEIVSLEEQKDSLIADNFMLCSENQRLIDSLSEIREVWAGSDACKAGDIVTETACEAYLQRLVKKCYQIAVEALK